jgi:serine protease Do
MKGIKKGFAGILVVALVLLLILGPGMNVLATESTLSEAEIQGIVDTKTDQSLITSPIIEVAKKAMESVVGVNNFGSGSGFEEAKQGTGSGTVISAYGHVLTNYHVIVDSSRVTVTVGDEEFAATVVGTDANLDIAVLLVPGLKLPAVQLGDSDAIQVGEYAIVIGNPLGQELERSVTVGVVSAVQRKMASATRDRYGLRTQNENQMIQVDAAISSGNSGGGLFNILGQLQGIPSMKIVDSSGSFFSSSGSSVDNIGMAVPINSAKPLIRTVLDAYDANEVKAQAKMNQGATAELETPRPRIGVSIGTLSTSWQPIAQGLLPQGAYISNIETNSPAEKAGLKVGDIIVEVNGGAMTTSSQVIAKLREMKEGDFVTVKVYRAEGLPAALENPEFISEIGKGEYIELSVELLMIDPVGM